MQPMNKLPTKEWNRTWPNCRFASRSKTKMGLASAFASESCIRRSSTSFELRSRSSFESWAPKCQRKHAQSHIASYSQGIPMDQHPAQCDLMQLQSTWKSHHWRVSAAALESCCSRSSISFALRWRSCSETSRLASAGSQMKWRQPENWQEPHSNEQ